MPVPRIQFISAPSASSVASSAVPPLRLRRLLAALPSLLHLQFTSAPSASSVASSAVPPLQFIAAVTAIALLTAPVAGQNVYEYGANQTKINKTGSGQASTDFSRYLAGLESRITSRGPAKFIGRVVITFTINKNGTLGASKVSQSSSMPQIDTTALDAVKHSAPFDALPTDAGKSVDIQFIFEGTSKGTAGHAIRLK